MRTHNHHIRMEAIRRWQSGEKKSEISRSMDVDYHCLLRWIARFKEHGEAGLKPKFEHCGRKTKVSPEVKEKIKVFREAHGDWGGAYIRLQAGRTFPDAYIPGTRQVQRLLKAEGLMPKRSRQPVVSADWARRPFERVQTDAKERLVTKDGKPCCYLTLIDEYTGAALEAFVFPLRTHQPSARRTGVRRFALYHVALGLHPLFSHGQWRTIWRPNLPIVDAIEPVPQGLRHSRKAEPSALTPKKRQGRAQPGNHCPVGRPREM